MQANPSAGQRHIIRPKKVFSDHTYLGLPLILSHLEKYAGLGATTMKQNWQNEWDSRNAATVQLQTITTRATRLLRYDF